MKQAEIIGLSNDELAERIEVEAAALAQLKMQHTIAQLENPMQISQKRRTIARLKTELRKRVQA